MSDLERYSALAWTILELKIAYYHPDMIHKDWKILFQSDAVYDRIEDEYKNLAVKLGLNPTACQMVGADLNRPSVKLVCSVIGKPKGRKKCSAESVLGI